MKVLLTGANGFFGSHLAALLQTDGCEVHSLGVGGAGERRHAIASTDDLAAMKAVLREVKPRYIFHLAGVVRASSWVEYFKINTLFAVTLLEAARSELGSSCPVLVMGSGSEYGAVTESDLPLKESKPSIALSFYGVSKAAQTQAALVAHQEGLPTVVARVFNLIGAGMPAGLAPQDFTSQAVKIAMKLQEPVLRVGPLQTRRDYLDVELAAKACWDLIREPKSHGQIVNVCSGQPTSIEELLQTILSEVKIDPRIESNNGPLARVDVPSHYGDPSLLERLVGWRPTLDLKGSVQRMVSKELSKHAPSTSSAT